MYLRIGQRSRANDDVGPAVKQGQPSFHLLDGRGAVSVAEEAKTPGSPVKHAFANGVSFAPVFRQLLKEHGRCAVPLTFAHHLRRGVLAAVVHHDNLCFVRLTREIGNDGVEGDADAFCFIVGGND